MNYVEIAITKLMHEAIKEDSTFKTVVVYDKERKVRRQQISKEAIEVLSNYIKDMVFSITRESFDHMELSRISKRLNGHDVEHVIISKYKIWREPKRFIKTGERLRGPGNI